MGGCALPPRDEQDYEARRQQIIDAALQVFASEGFERATNKDIAKAAHIKSPGLIYHYFKDKADLFRQVVEERATALQIVAHGDEYMDRPPREVLSLFGNSFVEMFENRAAIAMFKMLLGESARKPSVAQAFNRVGPLRGFNFLTRYLQHQMDLGNLRPTDPGAAVRCFMGPLLAYYITREIFVQADAKSLSSQTMVATAVDVFLNGMEVRDGA
jgi:TetR/AcrR family transcriptional regulator, mexJK operon transcriptional repressor